MSKVASQCHCGKSCGFDSLVVRPITAAERPTWDELMGRYHYLGIKSMVGPSIRYVAELHGQWVALLGWAAAALKCRPRDAWIGWPPPLQWQRLHLIANNCRFLILPQGRIHNLASKILSLNIKRLSSDWESVHGHRLLLAETFVDSSLFCGSCYKAANWIYVGHSRGFGKCDQHYYHHGRPKAVFLYPLHKRSRQRLQEPVCKQPLSKKVAPMTFTQRQLQDLIEALKGIPDPRFKRGKRHRQISILAIAICAVLCGARSYAAIAQWAKHRSEKQLKRLWCRHNDKKDRYEPPSEPTIRRLLQAIDAEVVDQTIYGWLSALFCSDAIAFDGKVLKGARTTDGSQLHLLSAVVHQQGITIAQKEVSSKTNEIPLARPLLQPLDLKDKVVTADAMHTQKDLAVFLVEQKHAHYCFTVKGNQDNLKEEIAALDLKKNFPP